MGYFLFYFIFEVLEYLLGREGSHLYSKNDRKQYPSVRRETRSTILVMTLQRVLVHVEDTARISSGRVT